MIDNVTINSPELGLTYHFDKDNSEYLLDDNGISISELKSNYNTYSVYGKIGKSMDDPQLNSGIEITLTGWIIHNMITPLDIKKQRLVAFFNPLFKLNLAFNHFTISGYPKSTVKFGDNRKTNNDKFCKYQVVIFCPYPGFKFDKLNEVYIPINYRSPYMNEPAIYPDNNKVVTINYTGSIPCPIGVEFHTNRLTADPTWTTDGALIQSLEVDQTTGQYNLSKVKEQFSTRSLTLTTPRLYTSGFSDLPSGWYSYTYDEETGEPINYTSAISEISLDNPAFMNLYPGKNAFKITDISGGELDCYELRLVYYSVFMYPKEVW